MNKIRYGISNVHVALITEDANGNITYGVPFPVKGTVSLNIDPQGGEPEPFYADNIIYFRSPATNEGYEGDLEVAIAPVEFLKQILAQVEDSDDPGILYEYANAKTKRFALLFQAEGDTYNTRFCFYDCMAGRVQRNNDTKEGSITPGADTIAITMNPRSSDLLVKSQIDQETGNATTYANWFASVKEPTVSV